VSEERRTLEAWRQEALDLRDEVLRLENRIEDMAEETMESGRFAEQYRDLFDHSLNALVLAEEVRDAEGRTVDAILLAVNRSFEELTGLSRKAVPGRRATELFPNVDLAPLFEAFSGISATREPIRITQYFEGADRYLDLSAFSPAPGFAAVSGLDVTESKRTQAELERLVDARTAELERSNRELADFAYVASHDLQEPLRTITGFIQLLEQRYTDRLDDAGRRYMDLVVDGAAHMQALIEGLLTYSRVQTHGQPPVEVDVTEAVKRALAAVRASFAESSVLVTWDDLPVVLVDETQLLQLLQNLLSNAIRFRSDATPEVHISATRQGTMWVFSVRDNGIGIDPAFEDRIFRIFERLHLREEVPGTGIGLAVCTRIVERHGGTMRVESAPGEGATFFFTLPASLEDG